MLEPYYARLGQYVSDIFEAINGDVPDFQNDSKGGLNKADGLWSKSRAGEFGLSIAGITNNAIKRRVIQNLYEDFAASISYVTGLTQMEQTMMEASTRKVEFNACVYVKCF